MNYRPYIGVSGIMHHDEALATIAAWRDAWAAVGREPTHDLMLGVLVSTKTLAGIPNKYPLRYPPADRIAGIFPDAPGVLNLLHLALDLPDIWNPRIEMAAVKAMGPRCHGMQINIATPTDPCDCGGFSALLQGARLDLTQKVRGQAPRLVFQVRPGDRTAERIAADACCYAGRDDGPIPGLTDVLIDGSGGTGRGLDVDRCEEIVAEIRSRTAKLGYGPSGIGIAGGLSAETVGAVGEFLRHGASIDAEGRLRDDAPGGGNLDLAKVGAYLRAAVALAAGASP